MATNSACAAAATRAKPRPLLIRVPGGGRIGLASVDSGGPYVVVGCENGYLRVLTNGKWTESLPCFHTDSSSALRESANTVHAVAVTEDGTQAIAGTEDGRLWHYRLPDERLGNWIAHRDRVTAVAVRSDRRVAGKRKSRSAGSPLASKRRRISALPDVASAGRTIRFGRLPSVRAAIGCWYCARKRPRCASGTWTNSATGSEICGSSHESDFWRPPLMAWGRRVN